ncbi:MAG: hypothetical protein OXM55_06585 [Bdellovibrionales bacterium]|nr:hypothetical protein [Bdellovibrionales bacterium]
MNATSGIFILLLPILFILSSFDVEAKRRPHKDPKNRELGNRNVNQEAETRYESENQQRSEDLNLSPRKVTLRDLDKNSDKNSGEKASPIVFISLKEATSIVDALSHKLGEGKVSETTKKNLIEEINKTGSEIGSSLLKLAKKVELARTEDVEVIVKFAENISLHSMTRERPNENKPAEANVLLDLVQNLHDMPFWEAQPRTTVMSVLKTFNEKLGKRAIKEDIEVSLQIPGPPALNSPHSRVLTGLVVGHEINVNTALMLAFTKNMIRMEDVVAAGGLQKALIKIAQRIRELCNKG